MPKVNGDRWRHLRAEMDLTSDMAAARLKIAGGALRQIETGDKPASLALAYRAARLYGCHVRELLADGNEGVPDEPPKQPKKDAGPARRQETEEKRTGPKREQSERVA